MNRASVTEAIDSALVFCATGRKKKISSQKLQ